MYNRKDYEKFKNNILESYVFIPIKESNFFYKNSNNNLKQKLIFWNFFYIF